MRIIMENRLTQLISILISKTMIMSWYFLIRCTLLENAL